MSNKTRLRVFALPLTGPRPNGRPPIVYYHVQSPPEPPTKNPHLIKKAVDKAVSTWTSFGKQDKESWKFKLYAWGERIADRVEFEETALRAVNTSFKPDADKPEYNLGPLELKAKFFYPKVFNNPFDTFKTHLRDREPYHKRYFWLWMLGLPVTAPIGIAPIIPNIPFYFCTWRAYCHRKAWNSTTYLNELVTLQYFEPSTDSVLDRIYDTPPSPSQNNNLLASETVSEPPLSEKSISSSPTEEDPRINSQILLQPSKVPDLVSSLELQPNVEAEILRAIEQVKLRLKKEQSEK